MLTFHWRSWALRGGLVSLALFGLSARGDHASPEPARSGGPRAEAPAEDLRVGRLFVRGKQAEGGCTVSFFGQCILTAAHCREHLRGARAVVQNGAGFESPVDDRAWVVHPDSGAQLAETGADIALAKLGAVPPKSYGREVLGASPVKVAHPAQGPTARLYGYSGRTIAEFGRQQNTDAVRVYGHARTLKGFPPLSLNAIVFGRGRVLPRPGDSGGPLFLRAPDGSTKLYGLIVGPSGFNENWMIASSIPHARQWLSEQLDRLGCYPAQSSPPRALPGMK